MEEDSWVSSSCSFDDDTCPICLEELKDPTRIERCLHSFCFDCILEWGHSTRECPLCKHSFNYVIHKIKSDGDFSKYHFDSSASVVPSSIQGVRRTVSRPTRGRHTGYSRSSCSTLISSDLSLFDESTLEKRRKLYNQKCRVTGNNEHRQSNFYSKLNSFSTSRFFQDTHEIVSRLSPWIQRDLQAILRDTDVQLIKNLVVVLAKKYDLRSPILNSELRPFLSEYTETFTSELLNFAKSSFTMWQYDRYVLCQDTPPAESLIPWQDDATDEASTSQH